MGLSWCEGFSYVVSSSFRNFDEMTLFFRLCVYFSGVVCVWCFQSTRSWCLTGIVLVVSLLVVATLLCLAKMIALDTADRIHEAQDELSAVKAYCIKSFEEEGCSDEGSIVPAMKGICTALAHCAAIKPHSIQNRALLFLTTIRHSLPAINTPHMVAISGTLVLLTIFSRPGRRFHTERIHHTGNELVAYYR